MSASLDISKCRAGGLVRVTDALSPCLRKGSIKSLYFCPKNMEFYICCNSGRHYLHPDVIGLEHVDTSVKRQSVTG